VLRLSISLVKAAEELYFQFSRMFVDCPEVAGFWLNYAGEEAGHARWLERFLDGAAPEQLEALGDSALLEAAYRMHYLSLEQLLGRIRTLEDAYSLADELESGETNAICAFLIECFEPDKKMQAFLRAQLSVHMARLAEGFPREWNSPMRRQAVLATR
jgi:hypothetical protein